jgi:alpha-1,6-mannosyltransferase
MRLQTSCRTVDHVRIVRLANFVTPSSGGLRTTLVALGAGYRAAGHEPVLVVPGDRDGQEQIPSGLLVTVKGTPVPWLGGYRVMLGRRRLAALLSDLAPDRLEVSDQVTLRWVGRWARERGVPAAMVAHESLFGLLGMAGVPGPMARWLADRLNAASVRAYDTILCTTDWAARDFRRLGAANVSRVSLGVDLETFHPERYDPVVRALYAKPGQALIVHCGRLSHEKRPGRSVEALIALRASGVDAVLVVAGDGPLRGRLRRRAAGVPVEFVSFVPDRVALAALLASADVVVAPGPVETFGLAALEALACGTPVAVDETSALPEVVDDAGVARAGRDLGSGVLELLGRPEHARRVAARRRAERYSWSSAVASFLAAQNVSVEEVAR